MSMSLGGPRTASEGNTYWRVIDDAVAGGITVVVASGNANTDACQFSPAFVPSAITVGSTTHFDRRSSFSNWGSCVDILAPGSEIYSSHHESNVRLVPRHGTSMACPHVSGAVAVLLQRNPSLNARQVKSLLLSTSSSGLIQDVAGSPNKFLYLPSLPTPSPP